MACIDNVIFDTFDVSGDTHSAVECAIGQLDVTIMQVANLVNLSHGMAEDQEEIDTVQALQKAIVALLGTTGPIVDTLYKYRRCIEEAQEFNDPANRASSSDREANSGLRGVRGAGLAGCAGKFATRPLNPS